MDPKEDVQVVNHMFAQERLCIDDPEPGRTCFLSHLGAQPKLVPGPWIGHRDLVYGLALANLTPTQRTSLARAVLIEHGREFGVGRLRLEALSSGLPLGGSSVCLRPRTGGPVCLYTWALGIAPASAKCDWLLLRAQPEWALDDPPPVLQSASLEALAALGGEVVVLAGSSVGAVQIAQICAGRVPIAAHPRYSPYIEGLDPDAHVLLWPHDALEGAGLRRHKVMAVVLVGAPEHVRQDVDTWRAAQGEAGEKIQVAEVTCPGRAGRDAVRKFWIACGRPRVLLTGDPAWAAYGGRWLETLGATVEVQGQATQLELSLA